MKPKKVSKDNSDPKNKEEDEPQYFTLAQLEVGRIVSPRSDPLFVKMFSLKISTPGLFKELADDESQLDRIERKLIIFIHNDLSNNKLMVSVMEDITIRDQTEKDLTFYYKLKNVMQFIDLRSSNISIDATEDWDNYGKI